MNELTKDFYNIEQFFTESMIVSTVSLINVKARSIPMQYNDPFQCPSLDFKCRENRDSKADIFPLPDPKKPCSPSPSASSRL